MTGVQARQYTNVAGLALIVYDLVITWDKELNRIWRTPGWGMKTMFFLGRYWALIFQTTNLIVTRPHFLKKSAMNCHLWFYFQNFAVTLSLVNFQLIMMLRVYALYERSTKMACFLCGWFVFYAVAVFLSSRKAIPLMKLDSNCMLLETPHAGAVLSFCVLCIIDQCILWGLTANKYRGAVRLGLSRNPILRLVMRDTSWSSFAICCMFVATLPYTHKAMRVTHLVYCLLSSLVSILTSRTILNMRGLSSSDGPLSIDVTTVTDLELTVSGQLE